MQALPPPPPYHCVAADAATAGSIFLTVSGNPDQLSAFLTEVSEHAAWSINAGASSNGVRFVRLKASLKLPYKEIGGLIFSAQHRQLAVAMTTDPLICETEEQ